MDRPLYQRLGDFETSGDAEDRALSFLARNWQSVQDHLEQSLPFAAREFGKEVYFCFSGLQLVVQLGEYKQLQALQLSTITQFCQLLVDARIVRAVTEATIFANSDTHYFYFGLSVDPVAEMKAIPLPINIKEEHKRRESTASDNIAWWRDVPTAQDSGSDEPEESYGDMTKSRSHLTTDSFGSMLEGSQNTSQASMSACELRKGGIALKKELEHYSAGVNRILQAINNVTTEDRMHLISWKLLEFRQVAQALVDCPTEANFTYYDSPCTDPTISSFRARNGRLLSTLISKFKVLIERYDDGDESSNMWLKVEDVLSQHTLIPKKRGWSLLDPVTPAVDYLKYNRYWYQDYFIGREHYNFISVGDSSPVIASLIVERKKPPDNRPVIARDESWPGAVVRGIIRSRLGNVKVELPSSKFGKVILSCLQDNYKHIIETMQPRLKNTEIVHRDSPELVGKLLYYESRDPRVTNTFKFGLLLCKEGQTTEEEMFCNTSGSEAYDAFLRLMGDNVLLAKHTGFSGGLDTKGENATGTHSVYTMWYDYEIMFHVSSLLPQSDQNTQQLHKKRHIGNDIVLVVFQEYGAPPYDPACIKSNYITVVVVVRSLTPHEPYEFEVAVARHADVPDFGPKIPLPCIFSLTPEFREWLLYLLINSELAAYKSKSFEFQFRSTYETMLNELVDEFKGKKKLSKYKAKKKQKSKAIRSSNDNMRSLKSIAGRARKKSKSYLQLSKHSRVNSDSALAAQKEINRRAQEKNVKLKFGETRSDSIDLSEPPVLKESVSSRRPVVKTRSSRITSSVGLSNTRVPGSIMQASPGRHRDSLTIYKSTEQSPVKSHKKLSYLIKEMSPLEDVILSLTSVDGYLKIARGCDLLSRVAVVLEDELPEANYVNLLDEDEDEADDYLMVLQRRVLGIVGETISKLKNLKKRVKESKSKVEMEHLRSLVDDIDALNINKQLVLLSSKWCAKGPKDRDIDFMSKNCFWYDKFFYNRQHCNLLSQSSAPPCIVSLVMDHINGTNHVRAIVRSGDGTDKFLLSVKQLGIKSDSSIHENWKLILEKMPLRNINPEAFDICFHGGAASKLHDYERKDVTVVNRYQFGVTLSLPDQRTLAEFYSNTEPTSTFEAFLDFMGEKVSLQDHEGFMGGLENSKCEESYYTRYNDGEVMFHVSTLLSQEDGGRRYIGNDFVIVIFQEVGSLPIDTSLLSSRGNYTVFIVLRSLQTWSGEAMVEAQVFSRRGVPFFKPSYAETPVFRFDNEFRTWLFTTMMNAELAAFKSERWINANKQATIILLKDLHKELDSRSPGGKGQRRKPHTLRVKKKNIVSQSMGELPTMPVNKQVIKRGASFDENQLKDKNITVKPVNKIKKEYSDSKRTRSRSQSSASPRSRSTRSSPRSPRKITTRSRSRTRLMPSVNRSPDLEKKHSRKKLDFVDRVGRGSPSPRRKPKVTRFKSTTSFTSQSSLSERKPLRKTASETKVVRYVQLDRPSDWTVSQVQSWLIECGHSKFCNLFSEHEIDGETLLGMSKDDFADLNIGASLRSKIKKLRKKSLR